MSAAKTMAQTLKAKADADKKAQEVEDKTSEGQKVSRGSVRVRLVRDMIDPTGRIVRAGIQTLPSDQVPKSAKILSKSDVEPIIEPPADPVPPPPSGDDGDDD